MTSEASQTDTSMKQTPLHAWHEQNGGRLVDFAGWSMPVQYQSVIAEHHQTRRSVGLFDVSHMGRFFLTGTGIDAWLDGLMTRRMAGIEVGRIRYSLVTNGEGNILDDVLVYHLNASDQFPASSPNGDTFYMIVVNAGNREKLLNHFRDHVPADGVGSDIQIHDRTRSTAMIAVQGPLANGIVAKMSPVDPELLPYYGGVTADLFVEGQASPAIVSRTGYTGEDGCELIVDADGATALWQTLSAAAEAVDGGASGLAARDTLRLEAGMPLYGHELSESINAAATSLRFAINLKGRTFIGRDAIAKSFANRRDHGGGVVRVGIELAGKRPAREGCDVFVQDQNVGSLTSGTLSPTLGCPIAMAYVHVDAAAIGTAVEVDVRGKRQAGTVVKLPFYVRGETTVGPTA